MFTFQKWGQIILLRVFQAKMLRWVMNTTTMLPEFNRNCHVQRKPHFPKFWGLDKSQHSLGTCGPGSPLPKGAISLTTAEGANGSLWFLLAYQSACCPPGSLISQPPVPHISESLLASWLFSPHPNR